jgi:serine/threonine protein phosphatase 1
MFPLATKIDGPMAVIGDVHGQSEQLLSLLEKLRALDDFTRRWIVFVGDFVDRGPEPRRALEIVLDLFVQKPKTAAAMGNHELALIGALKWLPTPDDSNWAQRYRDHYSAETTFASYGVSPGDFESLDRAIPEAHKEFLINLPWCIEHPDYLIVHAGLLPDVPFARQLEILRARDFMHNAPPWLCDHWLTHVNGPEDCPYVVVSGHVPVEEVIQTDRRILLDTTGGFGGDLSAVLLPEGRVITSDS